MSLLGTQTEEYMTQTTKEKALIANAAMLIRRPVAEVFEAFVNPAITREFWFTKGSARLEEGKEVRWEWEMYGAATTVQVKALQKNKRILVQWQGAHGPTTVEWVFEPRTGETTFVSVTNSGFRGTDAEIVEQALDSTAGFTIVLAGLKAYLEYKICLNLVADRFPDAQQRQ